jgi:hypothetical protein
MTTALLTREGTTTMTLPDYLNPARIQARGDHPMTAAEKLDEYEFLMGLRVQPETAAHQLGETIETLSYMAYVNYRPELGRALEEQLESDQT